MFEEAIRNVNPDWTRSTSQTILCVILVCLHQYCAIHMSFLGLGLKVGAHKRPRTMTVNTVDDVFDLGCSHGWQESDPEHRTHASPFRRCPHREVAN